MALAFGNTKGKAQKSSADAYTYADGEQTLRLFGGILPRYVYWLKGIGGKPIPMECLAFSRVKEKFDNLEALKQQITKDVAIAKNYFKNKI